MSMIDGSRDKVVTSRPLPELEIALEWPDCTVTVLIRPGPIDTEEERVNRQPHKITKSSGCPPNIGFLMHTVAVASELVGSTTVD